MKKFNYNLDLLSPNMQVGELIRIDVILASGQQLTIIDELKRTEISETWFEIIIKGRYNYSRIRKANLGTIRISLTLPQKAGITKPNEGQIS